MSGNEWLKSRVETLTPWPGLGETLAETANSTVGEVLLPSVALAVPGQVSGSFKAPLPQCLEPLAVKDPNERKERALYFYMLSAFFRG